MAVGGKTPHAGVSFDDTNLLVIDKMALGDPFTYVDTNNLIHYYESNNWLDLLYGTTWSTQHNSGIQGSSERARWSASLGYADDRSVIIATDDGIKKYNARMNADYDITKWLVFNMNISYSNRYKDSPLDGLDGKTLVCMMRLRHRPILLPEIIMISMFVGVLPYRLCRPVDGQNKNLRHSVIPIR